MHEILQLQLHDILNTCMIRISDNRRNGPAAGLVIKSKPRTMRRITRLAWSAPNSGSRVITIHRMVGRDLNT